MNFRVGQRVVCVNARPRHYPYCNLVEGQVYTVTWAAFDGYNAGICVAEAEPCQDSPYFYADRFRPAVEPSIEIFTAILTKTPKENRRAARKPVRERADA